MSDKEIATIARNLADALMDFAYTRKDDDQKRIALLNMELCKARRDEQQEEKHGNEPH